MPRAAWRLCALLAPAAALRSPLLFEHVNLNVPEGEAARAFYVDVLGGRLNPYAILDRQVHVNVGLSQFHILFKKFTFKGDDPVTVPQRWNGAIGLRTVEDLDALAARVRAAGHPVDRVQSRGEDALDMRDPWGNRLLVAAARPADVETVAAHKGHPGGTGSLVAMDTIWVRCPPGAAERIADFYRSVLGVDASAADGRAEVVFRLPDPAPVQTLVFEESPDAGPADAYDHDEAAAVHLAMYLPDRPALEAAYSAADARGAVYVNPRFTGGPLAFGSAATLEDALDCGQFRVKDLTGPDGVLALVLEHEVRAPHHKSSPLVLTKEAVAATVAGKGAAQASDPVAPADCEATQ